MMPFYVMALLLLREKARAHAGTEAEAKQLAVSELRRSRSGLLPAALRGPFKTTGTEAHFTHPDLPLAAEDWFHLSHFVRSALFVGSTALVR